MIRFFRHLSPKIAQERRPDPSWDPVWRLTFKCPGCGHETSIQVAGIKPPVHPVWFMNPHPVKMVERETAGSREQNWDDVTIEPSMKDLPHPRQVNCKAHFSVTAGKIIPG